MRPLTRSKPRRDLPEYSHHPASSNHSSNRLSSHLVNRERVIHGFFRVSIAPTSCVRKSSSNHVLYTVQPNTKWNHRISNSGKVVHAAHFLIDECEFSIAPRSLYCSLCLRAHRRSSAISSSTSEFGRNGCGESSLRVSPSSSGGRIPTVERTVVFVVFYFTRPCTGTSSLTYRGGIQSRQPRF